MVGSDFTFLELYVGSRLLYACKVKAFQNFVSISDHQEIQTNLSAVSSKGGQKSDADFLVLACPPELNFVSHSSVHANCSKIIVFF